MKHLKIKSDKLFFTSDIHFWHDNILKFTNRRFETIEEMNEEIVKRWNEKVPEDATVFILGDVTWKSLAVTKEYLDQLNGEKILIIGNHDSNNIISYFKESYDMLMIEVIDECDTNTYCHLCHFPIFEWNRCQNGSIMLHGHCHGSMDELDKENYKRLDVGMDSHNLTPISWEDVMVILNRRYLKIKK